MDFVGDHTIPAAWEDRADRHADEWFLLFESEDGHQCVYDYDEFAGLVDGAARAFHDELDVRKGDRVAVHLGNSPSYVRVYFALLKLGAVVVHSNPKHTVRETRYTLDQSDAGHAVTDPEHLDVVAEASQETDVAEVVVARTDDPPTGTATLSDLVDHDRPFDPGVEVTPEDPAQIVFTSGTTGEPKGVVHTHANIVYGTERNCHHLGMRPTDRTCIALPLCHVHGQFHGVLAPTYAGGTVVLLEAFSASSYVDQLRKHRATVTSLIGTQMRALLAQPEQDTDADHDVRELYNAINVTDEEKTRFCDRFDVTIVNGWGLTETLTAATMSPRFGDRRWPSVGLPTFDVEIHVVDDEHEPVGPDEVGEIAVEGERGQSLMKEYYGMPDRTEAVFTDRGWLLTGDMGRMDEAGYLYFVDRKKDIVETKGENVSIAEVEGVLNDHPEVAEAAVVGAPHDVYGEVVKAYVKSAGGDLSTADLTEHAEANLSEFKVPAEIVVVEEFPRTSIGKIDRGTLAERANRDG